MNGRNVLILIALSLIVSVALFHSETVKKKHEIDAVREGLSGATPFLSSNNNISLKSEPSRIELYMWPRYILAPNFISYDQNADTVLSIQYLQNGDSALSAFLSGRNILYQKTDSQYRYLVTARPLHDSGK